ncbi:uncharacterized protein [Macrobrachium rosenbergii]|uniref:uncharacterized protein n=1 Tax=Macrobrachium rosenbergii TaxID=79674 RepID=UPI0034D5A6FA
MSVREGTRRKKISVLHMLGTWEGKIEGCNCPSCKEYDEDQVLSGISKSPAKGAQKSVKGSKTVSKKTVIKVKTTKVVVDVGTADVFGKKHYNKKIPLKKCDDNTNFLQEFERSEECNHNDSDRKSLGVRYDYKVNDKSISRASEPLPLDVSEFQSYCNNIQETDDSSATEKESAFHKDIDLKREKFEESLRHASCEGHQVSSTQKLIILSSNQKVQSKVKQNYEDPPGDVIQIKQEPDDFLSDDEDFERDDSERLPSDETIIDSRVRKRARMVTAEVENIYAKPRMVFTGKGVVKKIEPGLDKTPKSRRGRKPSKNLSLVKVKQEPKDPEGNEDSDLDQLQKALTEAAENIDVGDDFIDALNDFDEEPQEVKVKKKTRFKMFKRVDSDGDKYIECNMCFKMLKESSMKQHYKTHTGEKPHTCDECDARFTRKGDVERHKRLVHKNQKPFKCRKCKRNFSDRKNLKLHLQNHDKAIYYACNTCRFKFGKREYYENHIRYIHPLPDGTMPLFGDVDQDIAIEQLQEIEKEEKKEKQEKEGKSRVESVYPIKREMETLDHGGEIDATEITVTENAEEHPKLRTPDKGSVHKTTTDNTQDLQNVEVSGNVSSDTSSVKNRSQEGTNITVSRGTLSFTQTVSDIGTQDEDLVNKVIADAVNQAANTIERLQTVAGANMSGNYIDLDDDDEEEDLMDDDEFQDILDSGGYDIIPVTEQKSFEQPSEIHISACVGGQKKKFIIQIPAGSNFSVQTPDGMEMIVSIVNQLCGGKGELDGPVEVVMQNSGTRTIFD